MIQTHLPLRLQAYWVAACLLLFSVSFSHASAQETFARLSGESPQASGVQPVSGQSGTPWDISIAKDSMIGKETNRASLSVLGSNGSLFNLSFTCSSPQLPFQEKPIFRSATLLIEIDTNSIGFGMMQTPEHSTVLGAITGTPESLPPYKTWIEVGLDDGSITKEPSYALSMNPRQVPIEFPEEMPSVLSNKLVDSLTQDDSSTGKALKDLLKTFMVPDSKIQDIETVTLSRLLRTDRIRLRVALNDGHSSIIEAQMDSSVKAFLTGCAPAISKTVQGNSNEQPDNGMARVMSHPMTADELSSRLPSILSQAAISYNLDPHVYDDEIPFISKAVHTCSQITAAMAIGVRTFPNKNTRYTPYPDYNVEDIDKLGDQYRICHGNGMYVPHPDGKPGPGLWLTMFVSGDSDSYDGQATRHWRDGQGFFASLHESGRSDTFFMGLIKQGLPSNPGVVSSTSGTEHVAGGETPIPMRISSNSPISRNDSQGQTNSQGVAEKTQSTAPALQCAPLPEEKRSTGSAKSAAMADIKKQADDFWKANQYTEAVPLYDKACAAGNQGACVILGWAYFHGNGIQQNDVHGMELWKKSCDAGYGEGCNTLGNIDEMVDGLSGPKEAAPLHAKGCGLGAAGSCFALAGQYRDGRGVIQNPSRAQQLYCKACALGVQSACSSAILTKHVPVVPGTLVNSSPE